MLGYFSKNIRINSDYEAESRKGYVPKPWDLGQAGYGSTSYHMERYNVTFFCLYTKCYYIEHDRNDAVIDTGITLTAGTKTRMFEFAGDLILTNPTDGLRQIHVMRLNDASPTFGDATVTVDQDGGARLNAFSHTSGNLRIRGTNEAFTSITTAGVVTLTGTLSQTYANNDIAIVAVDISSGKPFASKGAVWGKRMLLIGVDSDTNVDTPTNTVYISQFAGGRDLQKIIVFGVLGGAAEELLIHSGDITNLVTTNDYAYIFTKSETHYASTADINTTDGSTPINKMSGNYGCINEDCAVDMGNGRIVFLTNNRRVLSIEINSQSGQIAAPFPNEKFDQAIRNTLELLDEDQTGSHMFYHKAKRLLFLQVNVNSQTLTLIYDNNIGAWLPPDDNKVFSSYFEKNGILHATALNDDTIYEMDVGEEDDGAGFESIVDLPELEYSGGRMMFEIKEMQLSGSITASCTIQVENIVNGGTPQKKYITSSGLSFGDLISLGTVTQGISVLGGEGGAQTAKWDERFGVFPKFARSYRCILSAKKPFSVSSYSLIASALPQPVLTLK